MMSVALIFILLQPTSIDERAFPGFKRLEKTEMNPTASPIPATKGTVFVLDKTA